MSEFSRRSLLPFPARSVLDWHGRPGAFQRLSPPWERVEVVEPAGISPGEVLKMRLRKGPLSLRWDAVHHALSGDAPGFVDEQRRGPFARWRHEHRFVPEGDGCALEDRIDYALPLGALGRIAAGWKVRRDLERMFAYRHRQTRDDLTRHEAWSTMPRQRVLISGASGLVGEQLAAFLTGGGHRVQRLVRRAPRGPDEVEWRPSEGRLEGAQLEGVDAVVHLAGESVAGRWTAEKKRRIEESRMMGTRLLCERLAGLDQPPRVLISASAVGYYGARDEEVDEDAGPGDDFLARVCQKWEAACEPAREAGMRVVNARLGVVLTARGGALAEMLLPFKMGVGGPIGGGRQGFAWIALDDVIGALHHLVFDEEVSGAVNLTAPGALSQREFARALGQVLRRPALLPLPGWVVRALFGEFGEVTLLRGARVRPGVLAARGFEFLYPEAIDALRATLGRGLR